jgi:hypothetical protein
MGKDLKGIIKENLIIANNKKQKQLISENRIITNRYSILLEGRDIKNDKEGIQLMTDVINETVYLRKQKFNNELINEGLLDFITSLPFGDSIKQWFKASLLNWVGKKLELPTDSFLFGVLTRAFENTDFSDYPKLLTCDFLSLTVAESFAEQGLVEIQKRTTGTGFGANMMRNMLQKMFDNSEVKKELTNGIKQYVCPKLGDVSTKLSGLMSKIGGEQQPTTT